MKLPEELKEYLSTEAFGALCVAFDLGHGDEAVVVLKSSRDLLQALREAEATVGVGWVVQETAHGPVLCLVVYAAAEGVGDVAGEIYFDLWLEEDRRLLACLAGQEALRVVFLEESGAPAWVETLPWGEVDRLRVEQVQDRAEEYLERVPGYEFAAAKAAFQEAVPLSRLLELAFPDRG